MDNMITAVFGALRTTTTVPRHQWDYGQFLRFAGTIDLPSVYEVHFAAEGQQEAARILTDGSPVPIPDGLFITGLDIRAWVYVHTAAEDGETVYLAKIPVIPRAKPEDYEPTPAKVGIVEQAIEMLNREIDDIENAHQNALDAQAAQRAAETARDAAWESATRAASSAETAAQDAAEGAQNAIRKAMDAISTCERNAADSASSASANAQNAAQSASGAATSQTAAEAAQDRAEQAADDAETHSIGMQLQGTKLILTSPREE